MSINRPNVFSPSSSSTPDFFFDVARGAYGSFFQTLNISGYVDTVGTAEVVVAYQSGFEPVVSFLWTKISSNSANDAAAGQGARTVFITGVDASGDLAEEFVTMNGTTDVTLANSYKFINRVEVVTAGTSYTNVGNLIIEGSGAESIDIEAGVGRSQIGAYLVPNGYRLVLMSTDITAANAVNKTNLWVSLRKYTGIVQNTPSNKMVYRGVTSIDSSHTDGSYFRSTFPILFNPGELAYYTAEASSSANCIVSIQGYGILMADS